MIKFYFSSTKIIESDFILDDYSFTEVYHNNLNMAENSVKLKVPFSTELANNLKIYGNTDIKVEIKENYKTIFTGVLRKDFNFEKTQINQPISLEVLSPAVLLDIELGENKSFINKQAWEIIQYLLLKANLSFGMIPPLSKIIPVFTAEEKDNILDLIEGLCFESGYVFDFNEYGKFIVNPLFEIPNTNTITQFFDGTNINESVSMTKKEEEYNTIIAKWRKIEYFTDTLIFSDTQKGDDDNKCKIEIPANSFIFDREENYIEYDSTLGKILHVTNITNEDVIKDSGITWNLTNYGKRGLLKAKNTTNGTKQITKFDIYGNAYIQTATNETKTTHGKKSKEIEIKYLNDIADVENLINNIQNYYSYADYTIKLKSKIDYKIGSFVKVSEKGMGTIYARIIRKISYKQKAFNYELEAISEFTPAEIKTTSHRNSSKAIRGLRGLQGDKGEQGVPGKDGTTKFLASLTVQGDYENQIGTYQGQLYRWTNSKWALLNAFMPIMPICAYDFADVQYKDVTQARLKDFSYTFPAGEFYSDYRKAATDALTNGYRYKITADFEVIQGEAKFATMYYYDFDAGGQWGRALEVSQTPVVNGRSSCVLEFLCRNKDLQGHRLSVLFYNGMAGSIAPNAISKWSNFRIETISNTQTIDSSGNGIHSKIVGDVEKVKDDKVGMALKFNKGKLTRQPQYFIGFGKKWSHSRWIKLDNNQDTTTNPRLWHYGSFDYSFFNITENNGHITNIAIATYKDENNKIWYSLKKEKLFDGKYHNLIVMVDLQLSYVKKIIYLDGEKIFDQTVQGDFSNWVDTNPHLDMMEGNQHTNGRLANLLFFDRLLTDQEALWLYLNPQYPVKNYTLADWSISPDNPDNVIALQTPQYLGTVTVLPDNQNVFITNGKKTGNNIANIGDWVLIINNIDNYKKGWCYKWTSNEWLKLDPPENYSQEYTACLNDQLNKCKDLFDTDPHFFGTLFCKYLGFNEAVGKRLAANSGLFNNLTVKRLLIDNAPLNPNDFEMKINENDGIRVKNSNKVLFEVSPQGDAFFSGEIKTSFFEVSKKGETVEELVKITNGMKVSEFIDKYGYGEFLPDLDKRPTVVSSSGESMYVDKITSSKNEIEYDGNFYSSRQVYIEFTVKVGITDMAIAARFYNTFKGKRGISDSTGSPCIIYNSFDDEIIPYDIVIRKTNKNKIKVKFTDLLPYKSSEKDVLYYVNKDGHKILCIS